MEYPVGVRLVKLETRGDAIIPQEEKYPSNSLVSIGFMWEFSKPKVGEFFFVLLENKISPLFRTSRVIKILKENQEEIVFKTLNSVYKIIIDG